MGAELLVSDSGKAVFYCNTTNRPFGPVMDREEAELLDVVLEAHGKDPRVLATEPRNNDEGSALDEWREHVNAAFKLLGYEVEDVTGDFVGHIAWSIAHNYRKRLQNDEQFNALALLIGTGPGDAWGRLRDALLEWDVVL